MKHATKLLSASLLSISALGLAASFVMPLSPLAPAAFGIAFSAGLTCQLFRDYARLDRRGYEPRLVPAARREVYRLAA